MRGAEGFSASLPGRFRRWSASSRRGVQGKRGNMGESLEGKGAGPNGAIYDEVFASVKYSYDAAGGWALTLSNTSPLPQVAGIRLPHWQKPFCLWALGDATAGRKWKCRSRSACARGGWLKLVPLDLLWERQPVLSRHKDTKPNVSFLVPQCNGGWRVEMQFRDWGDITITGTRSHGPGRAKVSLHEL